ncbi:MAG: hypothetical protein ACYCQI_01680 [Gammaproteobacteria bacterium]
MISGRSTDIESKENTSQLDIYDSFSNFYKKPIKDYLNDYLRETLLRKPSPEPYYRLIQRLEYLTAEDKIFLQYFIDNRQPKSVARWSDQVNILSSKHYLLLGLFHNAFFDTRKAHDHFKLAILVAKKEKTAISTLNLNFAEHHLNTLGLDKYELPNHPGSLGCFARGLHYSMVAKDSLKLLSLSGVEKNKKLEEANKLSCLAIEYYQEGARNGCMKSLLQLGKEYWADGERVQALKCFDTVIALGGFPDACLTVLEMLCQDDMLDDQLFLKRKKYFDLAIAQGALKQYPARFSRELAINCQLIGASDSNSIISFSLLYRELIKQLSDSQVYEQMLNFHFQKALQHPIAVGHCIMCVAENANSEIIKSSVFKLLLKQFNKFVQDDPDLFFKMHANKGIAAGTSDYELAVEMRLLTPATIKIMKTHVLAVLREVNAFTQDVDGIVTQYMLLSQ